MAIEIKNFKPCCKNTLQGFVTVRLTEVGLEIKDICLHKKNSSEWLQLPSKPYKTKAGKEGWAYILDFYDKEKFSVFQSITLEKLKKYIAATEGTATNPSNKVPF